MQMPEFLKNLTEAQMASIRYLIAAIGVLLVGADVFEQTVWDQIMPGIVALATAAYGIWRTKTLEDDRERAIHLRDMAISEVADTRKQMRQLLESDEGPAKVA